MHPENTPENQNMIKEIFPHVPADVIKSAIEDTNGVQNACDYLSTWVPTASNPVVANTPKNEPKLRRTNSGTRRNLSPSAHSNTRSTKKQKGDSKSEEDDDVEFIDKTTSNNNGVKGVLKSTPNKRVLPGNTERREVHREDARVGKEEGRGKEKEQERKKEVLETNEIHATNSINNHTHLENTDLLPNKQQFEDLLRRVMEVENWKKERDVMNQEHTGAKNHSDAIKELKQQYGELIKKVGRLEEIVSQIKDTTKYQPQDKAQTLSAAQEAKRLRDGIKQETKEEVANMCAEIRSTIRGEVKQEVSAEFRKEIEQLKNELVGIKDLKRNVKMEAKEEMMAEVTNIRQELAHLVNSTQTDLTNLQAALVEENKFARTNLQAQISSIQSQMTTMQEKVKRLEALPPPNPFISFL